MKKKSVAFDEYLGRRRETMKEDSRKKIKQLLLAVLLLYGGFLSAMSLNDLSQSEVKVIDAFGSTSPQTENDNHIQIWFQAVDFNPFTRKATFNVFPWPSNVDKEFTSSAIVKDEFDFFLDEMRGKGIYAYKSGQVISTIEATFDVVSEYDEPNDQPNSYPFDTYSLDVWAKVLQPGTSTSLEKLGLNTFEYFYPNAVDNFDVVYKRFAGWENDTRSLADNKEKISDERRRGEISFIAEFKRPQAHKLSVAILSILMFLNSLSLIWTTIGVLSLDRPPSMQALIWSAASVLGTVELRNLFPGQPRLGIKLDYLVFFPTLLACLVVGVALTISWGRRSDFQS